MVGGMGVDISVPELALAIARLGGIGHLSDAMAPAVSDRRFDTHFVREKFQRHQGFLNTPDKQGITFDLKALGDSIRLLVSKTMDAKKGCGAIFLNVMEKLTMSNPRETLKTRLTAAMDAGIDGITMGAGLHLGSMELMSEHPRFHETKLGIIVSSARALKLFLHRALRAGRLPDYVIVEGPLAGGHLGFPLNWRDFDLKTIVADVLRLLRKDGLEIPVIAAGGVFTGADGVDMLEAGASGVQVATRFAVARESGLPDHVKQAFFAAEEDDVVVNLISPTGYPMRMLKQSPAIGSGTKPACEAYGYGLDPDGNCSYLDAYYREAGKDGPIHVEDKTCLCSQMAGYKVWTCGQYVYRLKDTTHRLPDGSYQLPTAEEVFRDYQFSTDYAVRKPPLPEIRPREAIAVGR